ncbi:MAG: hypothetical protein QM778_35665 [Myxococcales bacterium]
MTANRTRSAIIGLGLLSAGTALAANSLDATVAGWTPMVVLWSQGSGDTGTALKALHRLTGAYEAFLHKTEVDPPTQKFIDKAIKEFEDFDLEGFYKLLPDERNNRRELHVKGALSGGKYLVSRAEPGSGYEVGLDSRNGLADMSLLIYGKHYEGKEHDSLAAGTRFGLGLGQLSYSGLMEAGRSLSRLATMGDPRGSEATGDKPQPAAASIAKIKQSNPGLGSEDVESLAILYEAYPTLGDLLQTVGRLEDVRAVETNGYFHITTRMRAEPSRLKAKYPNFAKHIDKLNDVLSAKVRVLDDAGRDLVRLTVDSDKLLFGVECYVKDGQVLPFDDNQVYENEPLDTLAKSIKAPVVNIQARLNMLGIIVNLKNLRIDSEYDVHDSYTVIDSHIKTMPKVKVEGRALGLFSPGFLDVFISSNIQDITEEFFRTAVKGNDGKGVESHIELGSRTAGGPGVFALTASLEAMESWVIKFGGSVATDRLIMNKSAEEEAKQLAADLHDAFVKDLEPLREEGRRGGLIAS